jgi:hypothetical protein
MLLFVIFVGLPECGNEDLLQMWRHGTHSQGVPQCWCPCLAGYIETLFKQINLWCPTFLIVYAGLECK